MCVYGVRAGGGCGACVFPHSGGLCACVRVYVLKGGGCTDPRVSTHGRFCVCVPISVCRHTCVSVYVCVPVFDCISVCRHTCVSVRGV